VDLKYFNILLLLALVAGSAWLFCKTTPKQEFQRTLLITARVFVIGIWLLIISAVVYFSRSFPLQDDGKDEVLYERESPNKLYVASVFNHYGPATAQNTTRVSVRPSSERLDIKKNAVIFCELSVSNLDVAWDGDRHLIIRNERTEIYQQLTNWHDVVITYLHGPGD
jgi:hypothetical protein